MTHTTDLVHRYLAAIDPSGFDTDTLAAVLAPNVVIDDLLMPITGADNFIAAITNAPPTPMTSTIQEVVGDDETGLGSARVLVGIAGRSIQYHQWFWTEGGRITRVEVLYDPRPFLEMAAQQPG